MVSFYRLTAAAFSANHSMDLRSFFSRSPRRFDHFQVPRDGLARSKEHAGTRDYSDTTSMNPGKGYIYPVFREVPRRAHSGGSFKKPGHLGSCQ